MKKYKANIGGSDYILNVDSNRRKFTILSRINRSVDLKMFCPHEFDIKDIDMILNSKEQQILCKKCTAIIGNEIFSVNQITETRNDILFSDKKILLLTLSFLSNVEEMNGFLSEIMKNNPRAFDNMLKYFFPIKFGDKNVDQDIKTILRNLPTLRKWDMMCSRSEVITFIYDTNREEGTLVDDDEDQSLFNGKKDSFNEDMNDQFRWHCLLGLVTIQKQVPQYKRFCSHWNSKRTLEKLPPNFEKNRNFMNKSKVPGLIVIEYSPNMNFPKLDVNQSYFEKNQEQRSKLFDFYDGTHSSNFEWSVFVLNNRLDLLLEIQRKKKIYYSSDKIITRTYHSSIASWHNTKKVDFYRMFEVIFDGFTNKFYTYYEIALNVFIFLTDMILTEDYILEEDKVKTKKEKEILTFLKKYPSSSRKLSDFINENISLSECVYFILHYAVQDMPGVSVIEETYWFILGIVEQGYYSMNKIYPEGMGVYDKRKDLLPQDYSFRLSGAEDRLNFIELFFEQRKAIQIINLYLYFHNCEQGIKKIPAFNYRIWKLIDVQEIRPE